jgi:tRNA(Leu) C34 or U34 (ribose-2'-O)-methylase TrmL
MRLDLSQVAGEQMLRDYFAGQALTNPAAFNNDPKTMARAAYDYADAMMEERKRRMEGSK